MKHKIYIQTFGCQMNVADSEYIASMLLTTDNFELTDKIDTADIIIVNTCSVRQHAEDRAESFIGRLKKLKLKNENLKIIVLGCFAQRAKFELQKKYPFIDIIAGPLDYEYLPEILSNTFKIDIPYNCQRINLFNKVSVFLPIMTGCNNYCSYCIVPYVRGKEKSRSVDEILQEVNYLLNAGVKEIILIGQNVNSYQGFISINGKTQYVSFAELLEKVASLSSKYKFWLRFLTNHPKDMNYEIVKTIKNFSNISRHLHLPLQSASNRILQLMNRNYTVEKYKEIVQMIRSEIPEIAITTDLIVGFPTETEEDFNKTVETVKEIQFDSAFVFKYSPRKGTKAAQFPDDVAKEIKEKRHYELLTLCDNIARQKNLKFLNTLQEVLIVSHKDNKLLGKTLTNKTVEIHSNNVSVSLVGKFINIKVSDVKNHFLVGSLA